MSDKEFVNGLIVKPPRDRSPDFVKATISIKRQELIAWLGTKSDDWINLDVKESKGGKWYAEVNNWKKEVVSEPPKNSVESGDDIPF